MITGKTKLAGVMGWPVAHSRSPLLHNYWLKRLEIDGAYVPMPVHPNHLGAGLRGIAALGFMGCNITVPHKEEAFKLVDSSDDLAQKVGAVNTVIVQKDGTLHGMNTDVYGFSQNMKSAGRAYQPKKPAVVVGAGGAARAIIVALHNDGCRDIRLINRTSERAIALAKELNPVCGDVITPVGWPDRHEVMDDARAFINTTTQGMDGQQPLDISLRALDDEAVVCDIVYTPLNTPLLIEAKKRGHPCVDGLGMLIHQAELGFQHWFGIAPPVDADVRRVLLGE